MTFTITYYAHDNDMGDTAPEYCELYRAWAADVLVREYPYHRIRVLAEPSLKICVTDDEDRQDEIQHFCNGLWDRCPWDFGDDEPVPHEVYVVAVPRGDGTSPGAEKVVAGRLYLDLDMARHVAETMSDAVKRNGISAEYRVFRAEIKIHEKIT